MSRRILAFIAVLAAALAVLTGLAVRRGLLGPRESVAIGGPFRLVDQTGRTVDQSVLKGKWSAVFFGYTHCPDVCPTTLFELGQVEPMLGDKAADFQTVFITVDPERDPPAQMKAYVSNPAFPKRILALTGTPAQVDAAANAYHAPHSKTGPADDYQVSHTAFTYLMSPKGRFVCVIPYELTPEQTATKIKTAMAAGPSADSC
jgi:protein SCO1/2